jgi:hypothetical protein
MAQSNAILSDGQLDPTLTTKLASFPDRIVVKGKEYLHHPGLRAANEPSVIWRLGEEYKRNKQKFWRCGICNKNKMLAIKGGTSSALRHLKKDHNLDKQGKRIKKNN